MKVEFWGQEFKVNLFIGIPGAFLIAVASAMFGFGGGPFMVPLMAVGLRLPMYVIVGSSLLAIFFNTLMGSARHYGFGNFDPTFFVLMFPAAIIGGFVGPRIAKRVSPIVVKRVAIVGLSILAASLLGLF
jgi:uncharacterized membrane protein YfcA